jgi:hypothetical protein
LRDDLVDDILKMIRRAVHDGYLSEKAASKNLGHTTEIFQIS